MGFLSRFVSVSKAGRSTGVDDRAGRRGDLVHVFVFDSGGMGPENPKQVRSLVRSLLPESLAYADVPVTFIVDKEMPRALGQRTFHQLDMVMSYEFAWMKIKETNGTLVQGLPVGSGKFTFGWKEYAREGGHRGVLFAFYEQLKRR